MSSAVCQWCGGTDTVTTCPRSLECPTCAAPAGAPCKRPSGHRAARLHTARIRAAELVDDGRDLYLRCTDCGYSFPLPNTPEGERCSQCDGALDVVDYGESCPRCGQLGGRVVCPKCRELDRAPQGEALPLFDPGAAPRAGARTLF